MFSSGSKSRPQKQSVITPKNGIDLRVVAEVSHYYYPPQNCGFANLV